jgi:hypothetical protein
VAKLEEMDGQVIGWLIDENFDGQEDIGVRYRTLMLRHVRYLDSTQDAPISQEAALKRRRENIHV